MANPSEQKEVKECAPGWVECDMDDPCPRHIEYWNSYKNQIPQPPQKAGL